MCQKDSPDILIGTSHASIVGGVDEIKFASRSPHRCLQHSHIRKAVQPDIREYPLVILRMRLERDNVTKCADPVGKKDGVNALKAAHIVNGTGT